MPRFFIALICMAAFGLSLSACDSRIDDDIAVPQTGMDNPEFLGCAPTLVPALPFTATRTVPEDSTFADFAECTSVIVARRDTVVTAEDTTTTPITLADTSFVKAEFTARGDYYRLNLTSPRTVTVTVRGDSTFLPYLAISPARGDSVLAFATFNQDAADTDQDGELSMEEMETLSITTTLSAYGQSNALGYIISVGFPGAADLAPSEGAGYTLTIE